MDMEKGVVVPLTADLPIKEGEKKKQYLVALAGKLQVDMLIACDSVVLSKIPALCNEGMTW